MINNLIKQTKLTSAITPVAGAAGTTDIEGTTLDMQGFESVLMQMRVGAITTSAALSFKAQQGDESDLSDAADLEDTGITVADDDDNQIFAIDLVKPLKRYVRLYADRATQNSVISAAEYLQYDTMKAPITQDAGVTVETHISPDEGTA